MFSSGRRLQEVTELPGFSVRGGQHVSEAVGRWIDVAMSGLGRRLRERADGVLRSVFPSFLHERQIMAYASEAQPGTFSPSALRFHVSVLVVLVLACASTPAWPYEAECRYDIEPGTLDWRPLAEPQTQGRPGLLLSELVEGTPPGYFVRSEAGSCLGRIDRTILEFVGTCRHPESGRDHTLIHTVGGAYMSDVEIWSVDPVTKNPVRDYFEAWGDLLLQGVGMEKLVAADGNCLWQDRRKGRKIFADAMSDLRVGREVNLRHVSELPTRIVPRAAVHKWLKALDGIARFEGAVYAGDVDRAGWRVVQVYGVWHCESEGVVLLLDRKTESWRAIYDVPSGCMKVLNFPLQDMVIKDNRLHIWACTVCGSWGAYEEFIVDLRTLRVTPVRADEWLRGPEEGENPPIADIDREVLSD